MNSDTFPIVLAFFWYGLSLVIYIFAFIQRVENAKREALSQDKQSGRSTKIKVEVLALLLIGFLGASGLTLLLGHFNSMHLDYINQSMIGGVLVGVLVSKLLRLRR